MFIINVYYVESKRLWSLNSLFKFRSKKSKHFLFFSILFFFFQKYS